MQRKSTIAAVLTSLVLLTGTSIASAPAQAAAFPFSYEVFYGPNCYSGRTAFRHYEGYNAGEAWINDTFNGDLNGGSPGYGQKIRNNAASIYVKNANVGIFIDGQSRATSSYQAGAGKCFNFSPAVRNHNTGWWTYYYGG